MTINEPNDKMSLSKISSIILLGAGNDVALPVIRALGSAIPEHISIYTFACKGEEVPFSKYSRFITDHFECDFDDEKELMTELLTLGDKIGSTILLPLNEQFVRLLSKLQDKLKDYFYLPPLPSVEAFNALVYKNNLVKLLKQHSFPCAISHSLSNGSISSLNEDFFPCLLKPVRGSSGRGIRKVSDQNALTDALTKIKPDAYILQEFIPGNDIDCSLFAIDGEIKAITIQKGLKSKGFSFSTAIEFTDNDIIVETAKKLVAVTNYSGLAHLDFRLDERDNQPKLIDFNARFWLSLLGSKAAGVNFALLYCMAALDIPFDQPKTKKIKYMMGTSALQHYYGKLFGRNSAADSNSISTDLWGRISDPMPEIARFYHSYTTK